MPDLFAIISTDHAIRNIPNALIWHNLHSYDDYLVCSHYKDIQNQPEPDVIVSTFSKTYLFISPTLQISSINKTAHSAAVVLRRKFHRGKDNVVSQVEPVQIELAVIESQAITMASKNIPFRADFAMDIVDQLRSPMYKLHALVPELVMTVLIDQMGYKFKDHMKLLILNKRGGS